jgi:hypothetical protein
VLARKAAKVENERGEGGAGEASEA